MQFHSRKIIIDTGFLVALFNKRDEHHIQAKEVSREIDHLEWNSTPFVIQEIFWLLSKRESFSTAVSFLQKVKSFLTIPNLTQIWPERLSSILGQFASAKIDLADASLIMLADHLKTGQIVSVDRKDFSILRWNSGCSAFINWMDVLR